MRRAVDLLTAPPTRGGIEAATLFARAVLGWVFLYHGGQKLFGWFKGGGLSGTGQYFDSVGVKPGELMALLAGLTEFVGAILILLGLLTRIAASLLAVEMLIVLVKVNWVNGLIAEKAAGGFEINLALAALGVALAVLGAGRISLDAKVLTRR
jgi:putative oxidoreductase